MLLQFSVSNFRCFRERQTLDLAVSPQDKSLPGNCLSTNLPGLAGKRWTRGVALYGANASGKTTMLAALEALATLVKRSAAVTDPKEPVLGIEPFSLCLEGTQPPTAFAVVFVAEGVRYEYRVAATREQIWHESLRAFPKAKQQVWFSRDWNPDSEQFEWSPENPTGFQRDPQLESYTLRNMLFLSKAVASNRIDLDPIFRWFKEKLRFLNLSASGTGIGMGFTLRQLEEQTSLHDRIVELLRHADLGVTHARAIEHRPPDDELEKMASDLPVDLQDKLRKRRWVQPELTHKGNGDARFPLPWSSESAGIHRLFSLAGPWLDILTEGYTVCIDELETSMHPLMLRELLRMIFSEQDNPKGAQIIFTTHNPLLLDLTLLRRDQVWLTDKDENGESHLYPLTDFSPRNNESLVRGYMSGRYGAVPFIPGGLLGRTAPHAGAPQPKQNSHE